MEFSHAVVRTLDVAVNAAFTVPYVVVRAGTIHRARKQPLWHALNRELKRVTQGSVDDVAWLDNMSVEAEILLRRDLLEEHLSFAPSVEGWLEDMATGDPVTAATREAKWAWQRIVRGWDDRATWSLDHYLYRTLGAQLVHLADTTHVWPSDATDPDGETEFATPEDWCAALRYHGETLITAGNSDPLLDTPEEEATVIAANESLLWVVDHVGYLWD